MDISEKTLQLKQDFDDVFKAGKNKEWNEFWDSFQENGNRVNYGYAFSNWKRKIFKPKYDIITNRCQYMFNNTFASDTGDDRNLKKALEDAGVILDTSQSNNFQYMFWYAWVSDIPTIDTRSANTINYIFNYATRLEKVEKLILKDDGSQASTGAFESCSSLKDIIIEGKIGQNFDIKNSPLTKDSITSIVNALSSSASGKTVSFSKTAKEKAFTTDEWDALINTKPNWTFSLV